MLDESDAKRDNSPRGLLAKRTVTVTVTTSDSKNYCGQSGLIGCIATVGAVYTQGAISTYNSQSTYYQNSPSTVYVTVTTMYYVTSTVTGAGNTVTLPRTGSSNQPTTTSSTPRSTSSSQGASITQPGATTQGPNGAQLVSSSVDTTVTRPVTVYVAAGRRRMDAEGSCITALLGGIAWHLLGLLL